MPNYFRITLALVCYSLLIEKKWLNGRENCFPTRQEVYFLR